MNYHHIQPFIYCTRLIIFSFLFATTMTYANDLEKITAPASSDATVDTSHELNTLSTQQTPIKFYLDTSALKQSVKILRQNQKTEQWYRLSEDGLKEVIANMMIYWNWYAQNAFDYKNIEITDSWANGNGRNEIAFDMKANRHSGLSRVFRTQDGSETDILINPYAMGQSADQWTAGLTSSYYWDHYYNIENTILRGLTIALIGHPNEFKSSRYELGSSLSILNIPKASTQYYRNRFLSYRKLYRYDIRSLWNTRPELKRNIIDASISLYHVDKTDRQDNRAIYVPADFNPKWGRIGSEVKINGFVLENLGTSTMDITVDWCLVKQAHLSTTDCAFDSSESLFLGFTQHQLEAGTSRGFPQGVKLAVPLGSEFKHYKIAACIRASSHKTGSTSQTDQFKWNNCDWIWNPTFEISYTQWSTPPKP